MAGEGDKGPDTGADKGAGMDLTKDDQAAPSVVYTTFGEGHLLRVRADGIHIVRYAHPHTHTHTYVHTRARAHEHTIQRLNHFHAHAHAHTHAHTHTHTHSFHWGTAYMKQECIEARMDASDAGHHFIAKNNCIHKNLS
jgi:hypothetical protein